MALSRDSRERLLQWGLDLLWALRASHDVRTEVAAAVVSTEELGDEPGVRVANHHEGHAKLSGSRERSLERDAALAPSPDEGDVGLAQGPGRSDEDEDLDHGRPL